MYKAAFEAYANASDKFGIACSWACFSRVFKHSSTSLVYQNALVRDVEHLHRTHGSNTARGHQKIRKPYADPLGYASFLIERGQLETVVEVLEQGRALLWSEMRGLRTPVDQLCNVDPALADKFRDVSQALEAVVCPFLSTKIRKSLQVHRKVTKKPTHSVTH